MIIEITLKGIFFVILYIMSAVGLFTVLYLVRAFIMGFINNRKEHKIMLGNRVTAKELRNNAEQIREINIAHKKELLKTRDNARKKGDS